MDINQTKKGIFVNTPIDLPTNSYLSKDDNMSSFVIPMMASFLTCTKTFLKTRHTADTRHGVTTLENLAVLPTRVVGEPRLAGGERKSSPVSVMFDNDNKCIISYWYKDNFQYIVHSRY